MGANAQFSLGKSSTESASASAVVQTDQVRAELIAHAPDGVDPGKTIWVGLQLQHQPQWHTYWKNPGDSGLPTQLQWSLPAGVDAGEIVWPTPKKIRIGSLANFGFEGTTLLPVPLQISPQFKPGLLAQDLEVKLHAQWLVCRQECIPQEGDFVLKLPLRSSTAIHATAFEAARAASPKPLPQAAQATVDAHGLRLQVQGLPVAWQGKALNAFVATPELLDAPASPDSDNAVSSAPAKAGTQQWSDGTWSARMPMAPNRSASPTAFEVVLSLGAQSVQTQASVQGAWPTAAAKLEVSPALQQALAANALAAQQTQESASVGGFVWALLAAVLGGLILNLMPCVFPVLAIKVLGFASQHKHSRAAQRAQGLAYTAGVVVSFLALGGLMLALRAGGEQLGWGFQLQSPAVIAGLALLFTLLGLNLMGVMEFGNWLPAGWAGVQLRHPSADAFLSGVLAVAVASPCTAPFMGASLGYAIALPAPQALGIFAALGLGLALPYLLASWVPAMGNLLPRPGAWMQTLRHFMAFLMWATVVWLVWVLGHLSGIDGAASLLALLLAVAVVVWALQLPAGSRRVFATLSIAASAILVSAIGQNVLKIEGATVGSSETTAEGAWQAWAPGRVDAELAKGTPVFVDFTAAWCITCQYNKKTTLNRADVLASFAAKRVTLLRADWTRRDPAITQALQQLGRSGLPVYVLYTPGRAPVVMSEILNAADLQASVAAL
ncbi:protein-disulfide reductase DsbD family protein [Rhodoferax aquaticus]|uniref:Protein-disulfide reductase n=1 Tax=Rhodoferax aquaticus TaxID=2527691 RepID=A0A515EU10_9BURK|nr:thioredoxin family protein [Rhodoferax aquaticus]QDL56141.1 protein-disulfide reductase [Rhodoferax aquaticus]